MAYLSSDTDGASVEVALAHHDATHGNEGRSGEAEHLSAKSSSDGDVNTIAQATICLKTDTAAETCTQKHDSSCSAKREKCSTNTRPDSHMHRDSESLCWDILTVEDKRLVSLSDTQLERQTGVLNTSPARSASATVVAADKDVVGLGLGNSRSDDSHTHLRNELDGDVSAADTYTQVVRFPPKQNQVEN
jgi:hypothetical protein